MVSLIQQLQSEALEQTASISGLLRKTLVVARKLDQPDLAKWAQNELAGYEDVEDIPDYRRIPGRIVAWNPYHGWQPVMWQDDDLAEAVSHRVVNSPIAELEALFDTSTQKGTEFQMTLDPKVEGQIRNAISFDTQVTYMVAGTSVFGIVDAIRNAILQWALQLESDGIYGEGISFSNEEKKVASAAQYHIQNYIAGDINESQIQQHSPGASQQIVNAGLDFAEVTSFVSSLESGLASLGLEQDSIAEISADIATIKAQLDSPKPKQGIVRESLSSMRTILEAAAGSVAGQYLMAVTKILVGA